MLKSDIKRNACDKMGINPDMVNDNLGLLAGQTISKNEIESFSSYKLMNADEKATVEFILNEMKSVGANKGKALVKHIDSLVPMSEESLVDFKDAA